MSDQVRQRVEKLRDQHAAKADRLEAASCTVRSMIARRSATNYRDSILAISSSE